MRSWLEPILITVPPFLFCSYALSAYFVKHATARRMSVNQAKRAKGWHEERYRSLIEALVTERKRQGLSQYEFAARLGRQQHFISRYETGERRLDVIEFTDIAASLGLDFCKLLMAHGAGNIGA
jgi:ribosome-binding protein aMBF1 (putative translation factor)